MICICIVYFIRSLLYIYRIYSIGYIVHWPFHLGRPLRSKLLSQSLQRSFEGLGQHLATHVEQWGFKGNHQKINHDWRKVGACNIFFFLLPDPRFQHPSVLPTFRVATPMDLSCVLKSHAQYPNWEKALQTSLGISDTEHCWKCDRLDFSAWKWEGFAVVAQETDPVYHDLVK